MDASDSSSPHTRRPSDQKRLLSCCVQILLSVPFGLLIGLYLADVRMVATAVKNERKCDFLRGRYEVHPGDTECNVTHRQSGVPISYNYSNPGVESMLKNYFANDAVEHEVRKHDRWVIESLSFLNNFNGAASYEKARDDHPKTMTLAVLTVNRRVPYISVILSTLLRGNHPTAFVDNIEMHIINIERRAGRERYYLLDEIKHKLPFIQYHDWTTQYPQHAGLENPYLADQRLDYTRVLQLCEASRSSWCVVMEDDAVPCSNFVSKFKNYVDKDVFTNASKDGMEDVHLDQIAMVKLFNPFNPMVRDKWDPPKGNLQKRIAQKMNVTHEMFLYESNRAADWSQTHGAGVPVEKIDYQVKSVREWWSIVANAYPLVGLNRTIAFLGTEDSRLGHPTDVSLTKSFVRKENLVQLGTLPSLVNHIGFYSENKNKNWKETGISTDVRFQLDDGS